MLEEVMQYLALKPGDVAVDCTLGGGGYTAAISDIVGASGSVIAIDADEMAIRNAELRIKNSELPKNITLVHDNFRHLKEIIATHAPERVNGIVFDCGLSSAQLEDATRGFSFAVDAPLNMRFGIENVNNLETETIVNTGDVAGLKKIIKNYGEERFAGRIAEAIVRHRPLRTTKQLADVIVNAVPKGYERGRIHPATRTFQALRIATNDELEGLQQAVRAAVAVLSPGGRVVVISFHSLEDRIVKQVFKQAAVGCICPPEAPRCVCTHEPELRIITKKIITAREEEVRINPRARSAKLRAAEKL